MSKYAAQTNVSSELSRLEIERTLIRYGACVRIAKEMGYEKIITYILESENGASVKASNFICECEAAGKLTQTGARQKEREVAPKELKKRYAYYL